MFPLILVFMIFLGFFGFIYLGTIIYFTISAIFILRTCAFARKSFPMELPRLNISVKETMKKAIILACAKASPRETITDFARKAFFAELQQRKTAARALGAGK